MPVVGCTQVTDLRIAHHAGHDKRKNDNKSFQLALYELDPESISSISEMAYKADISLTEISGLLSGKEVESVSCTMAEHVSGKNTYYRVTYSHNLRENLKLSDLY